MRLVVEDEVPGPPANPGAGECLACFVERMVVAYGCSNRLLFVGLWRDRAAPSATALERRLGARGGYCDCEVLHNVYWRAGWDRAEEEVDDDAADAPAPPCRGVRRGSTRPCPQWVSRPSGGW